LLIAALLVAGCISPSHPFATPTVLAPTLSPSATATEPVFPTSTPTSRPPTEVSTPTRTPETLDDEIVPIPEASRLKLIAHFPAEALSVAWSRDSSTLALGITEGGKDYLQLISMATPDKSMVFDLPSPAWALAFSPDGQTLAVVHQWCWPLRFLDLATLKFTESPDRDCQAKGIAASYSPEGDFLYILDIAGSLNYGDNSWLRVCRTPGGTACRQFKSMKGISLRFALLQAGQLIAPAVYLDSTHWVYLWRVDNGQLFCAIHGIAPVSDPAGRWLAVWDATEGQGKVVLWDASTCKQVKQIETTGRPVAMDASGAQLVVHDNNHLRLLDVATANEDVDLVAPDYASSAGLESVLSPDWRYLAVIELDNTVSLLASLK